MTIRDLVMSVAGIVAVIALIALADPRLRERIGGTSARTVSYQVVNGTTRVEAATRSVSDIALDNGPLALLVIAGGVLFVCMFRT